MSKYYFMFALIVVSLIYPAINLYKQFEENSELDAYLKENNLNNLPVSKDNAYRVSDQLRADFNVNQETFKHLSFKGRPFLREPASEILEYKEGLCGEGTRVLINLLERLGYDATRVSLYNRKLHSSHTLVSVKEADREYFVDSINSMSQVNQFLKTKDINASEFHLLKYIDDLGQRKAAARSQDGTGREPDEEFFFNKYWLYSYEAQPFSKIFSKLGMDVRAFNLDRPNRLISSLAEKPYLINFALSLLVPILLIVLSLVMLLLDRMKSRKAL